MNEDYREDPYSLFQGKRHFSRERALSTLLLEEVIYINDHRWRKYWPWEAQRTTSLSVQCGDFFDYACSDVEEVSVSQLQELYDMWMEDRKWGAKKWCALRRWKLPLPSIAAEMKACGAWDDSMKWLEGQVLDGAKIPEGWVRIDYERAVAIRPGDKLKPKPQWNESPSCLMMGRLPDPTTVLEVVITRHCETGVLFTVRYESGEVAQLDAGFFRAPATADP